PGRCSWSPAGLPGDQAVTHYPRGPSSSVLLPEPRRLGGPQGVRTMRKVLGIIASAAFTTALLAACTGGARQDESPRSDPPETYAAETHAMQRARLAALEVAAFSAPPLPQEPLSAEVYAPFDDNGVWLAATDPVSTFSIDVDTGSYANVRRWLNQGRLPPEDAVRVEEMINYFDYAYARPRDRGRPFSVSTTLSRAPWNADAHLLRIA